VRKGSRSSVYLRLVEAYRNDQGQVRHRVLRTLGREDELKTSDQLDQLAASFARLDPPEIGTRRVVGPSARRALPLPSRARGQRGPARVDTGPGPAHPRRGRYGPRRQPALRACPLSDIAGWASSAAVSELFAVAAMALNDDRLGRALEALAPVAETLAPRSWSAPPGHSRRAGRDEAAPRSQALASRGLRGLGAREEGLVGRSEDRPTGEDAPGIHRRGRPLLHPALPGGDWRAARVHGSDRDPRKDAPSRSRRRRLRARIPREPRSPACREGLLRRLVAADTGLASASEPRCEAGSRPSRHSRTSRRPSGAPAIWRTSWRGLFGPFAVHGADGTGCAWRVAYIWSDRVKCRCRSRVWARKTRHLSVR
jgi:hypothetical protein